MQLTPPSWQKSEPSRAKRQEARPSEPSEQVSPMRRPSEAKPGPSEVKAGYAPPKRGAARLSRILFYWGQVDSNRPSLLMFLTVRGAVDSNRPLFSFRDNWGSLLPGRNSSRRLSKRRKRAFCLVLDICALISYVPYINIITSVGIHIHFLDSSLTPDSPTIDKNSTSLRSSSPTRSPQRLLHRILHSRHRSCVLLGTPGY